MFSDKENINILTALLVEYGVETAVVCPGSRNAPIAHNLLVSGVKCVPVTDERSAGFYALGISLATRRPVVVCVTSGSAALNLAPAVAEAAYRRVPLVIVSADRPASDIGQLGGQTIDQLGIFSGHVACEVNICAPADSSSRAWCARKVCEAMMEAERGMPVHINVPLTEPLYNFNVERLPEVRPVRLYDSLGCVPPSAVRALADAVAHSRHPMIVIGQCWRGRAMRNAIRRLRKNYVVLCEVTAGDDGAEPFDDFLASPPPAEYSPDFVLYLGSTLVSNRIKSWISSLGALDMWAVSADGGIHDPFRHVSAVIEADAGTLLENLANVLGQTSCSGSQKAYKRLWDGSLSATRKAIEDNLLSGACGFAETVVGMFERLIDRGHGCDVHYANSSVVRMANRHARHYCHVNRGVNGIEGSLSVAAGFSLYTDRRVYCVIGDLSFFYDSNALWPASLGGNLRILLVNDGGGGIFSSISGAAESPAFGTLISAGHGASAMGICASYGIDYRVAADTASVAGGLEWLVRHAGDRPHLLEVKINSPK